MELTALLQSLPDSLRENPFGDKMGIQLTSEEMKTLSVDGEVSLPDQTGWRCAYADTAHTHLQVLRHGYDDGLQYDLLRLPARGKQDWVLVLQTVSDHCCNFGRWGLYELDQGVWIDHTAAQLPKLSWNDFFKQEIFGVQSPEAMRANHYPLQMELVARPPSIQISPVADYVELSLPAGIAAAMFEHWPSDAKVLAWQAGQWEWR